MDTDVVLDTGVAAISARRSAWGSCRVGVVTVQRPRG